MVSHYKRTPQQAAMLGIEVTWRCCAPFMAGCALPIAGGVVSAFCTCEATWPGHALLCPSLPGRPQMKRQVQVEVNAVSGLSCCRERSWMRSQLILQRI